MLSSARTLVWDGREGRKAYPNGGAHKVLQ